MRKAMKKSQWLKHLRRRFRTPIIRCVFALFARLPLRFAHMIGHFVGWCLWISNGNMRRISEINIRACLPQMDYAKQRLLVKKSLIETGKAMAEVPVLWSGDSRKFNKAIKNVFGLEHVENALAHSKGLVFLTPHLGSWEVAGLYFSTHYPMVTMYRPSQVEGVDDLIKAGRTRFGAQLVATDVSGVRQLFQALKKGHVLGILPDQDPGKNGGEFVSFFGIPANTMTLTNRIINKSGAAVIFCYAQRLEKAEGYNIHIYPSPPEIASDDVAQALSTMNNELENVIKQCPEQYQWSYKRFKSRPAGEPKFY